MRPCPEAADLTFGCSEQDSCQDTTWPVDIDAGILEVFDLPMGDVGPAALS